MGNDGPVQHFTSLLGVNYDDCLASGMWIGEPGYQVNESLPCYQTLRDAFTAQYGRNECEGHNSHLYQERWVQGTDKYGHEIWYPLPMNETVSAALASIVAPL